MCIVRLYQPHLKISVKSRGEKIYYPPLTFPPLTTPMLLVRKEMGVGVKMCELGSVTLSKKFQRLHRPSTLCNSMTYDCFLTPGEHLRMGEIIIIQAHNYNDLDSLFYLLSLL